MSYYDNVNPDLLAHLPLTARDIVEIGSGSGALGAAFKRRVPQARWTGIEVVEAAAARARAVLDEVVIADVEAGLPEDWQGRFDALAIGDVLEHLRDPWTSLQRLAACLREGATVAACIPNTSHWSVVATLLRGQFPYADQGLFDRTHLRFFALPQMRELFAQAGLSVTKIVPRRFALDAEGHRRFCESAGPLLASLSIDPAEAQDRLQTLQYVLVAEKRATPAPQLHIANLGLATPFLEVRAKNPARALASLPDVHLTYAEGRLSLPNVPAGGARVFVQQRPQMLGHQGAEERYRSLSRQGWVLVTDWDDHAGLIKRHVEPQRDLSDIWAPVVWADAVQVSTPALADIIREVRAAAGRPARCGAVEAVEVFDNRLLELPPAPEKPEGPVTILLSALNREAETRPWLAAIDAVLERHSHAQICVVHDQGAYDALRTPRKSFRPVMPYAAYLELMANAHIALLPLGDTIEERCKSDVKFVEAASRNVVCVASRHVYDRTMIHGVTGFLVDGPDDVAAALDRLLESPETLAAIAVGARDYVATQRMLSQDVARRAAWYRGLATGSVGG